MDEIKNCESNGEWVVLDDNDKGSESEESQMPSSEMNSENIYDGNGLLEPCVEDIEFKDSECFMYDDANKLLDATSDLVSVSKIRCYKHDRNDRLNFILNMTLVLVVATAVGFGSGHFLGWSHKCQNDIQDEHVEMFNTVEESEKILKAQTLKKLVMNDGEKMQTISMDTGFSHIVTFDPTKIINVTEKTFLNQNVNTMNDNYSLETSAFPSLVVSEQKQADNNSHDDTYTYGSEVTENIDSDRISNGGEIEDSHNIEGVRIKEKHAEFELLKELHIDVKHAFNKNSNLVDDLRRDFSYVIQSLNVVALSYVSQTPDTESGSLTSELELIKLTYDNFQTVIDDKLSQLENLIKSPTFETVQKSSRKFLQKMVFSLINSVENFLKSSTKTFKKDFKNWKIEKFHRGTMKSIEDLNRKFERCEERWLSYSENVKDEDFDEKFHKKPIKHWKKKKFHSDKEIYRNKNFNRRSKEVAMKA